MLNAFGLVVARSASKEMEMAEKSLKLMEDSYLTFFKYVDMD